MHLSETLLQHERRKNAVCDEGKLVALMSDNFPLNYDILTVPKGATTDAGAKPYDMKLPISPTFMRVKPNHLEQTWTFYDRNVKGGP